MGRKSKQAQRTKNNSGPSNSGRSAVLLGSTVPSFVGFSAHSGLGILPLAAGFLAERLPDNFDASINPKFQVVLRRMSKKDPVTKAKALQEFTELITSSDLPTVKTILSLWPKFYHSIANDVEHRVREAAQQAQAAVVVAAGKNIAPFLKHLVPVWLTSQFDNYAPAAQIASSSFKSAFPPKKRKEVFIFCQREILDYVTKNLTIQTATSLTTSKTYTAEEAENKYQRILICSLRAYSLYLMEIPIAEIDENCLKNSALLQNQKFWGLAKHKIPNVRAAWFESISSLLQNTPGLLQKYKPQLITLIFLNMADTDPVVLPQVWCCILLVQDAYEDWHMYINVKKVVIPKLLLLIKSGGSGSGLSLCPHYLPLISKFTEENIQGCSLEDFYNDFFRGMKTWFTTTKSGPTSKSELSSNIFAFYECFRYVIQKKAIDNAINVATAVVYIEQMLEEYVIDIIKWSTMNENSVSKCLYSQISRLVAFWTQNLNFSKIYSNLVDTFWTKLMIVVQSNGNANISCTQSHRFMELINCLYNSTLNLSDNTVQFSLDERVTEKTKQKIKSTNSLLHAHLRQICSELAKIFIEWTTRENTINYLTQLELLFQMFNDFDFYSKLSNDSSLISTINVLIGWLHKSIISESIVDMTFDILLLINKKERIQLLNYLLAVPNSLVQQCILQHFLSYPLCVEPEIRHMLSQPHVSNIILRITEDVIKEHSTIKINLLRKCFFQIDSGDILIDKSTVDEIIKIMSEPLTNENQIDMLDTCGSFIAQIMPVICSNNTNRDLQRKVFLMLFRFSVNITLSDYISKDTLWEITTCWQDTLSSEDIQLDEDLISKCFEVIQRRVLSSDILLISDINNIAEITAKLILCSTENIINEEERYTKINNILESLLESHLGATIYQLENFCSYVECLLGIYIPNKIQSVTNIQHKDIINLFRTNLFQFSTILKLTCSTKCESKSRPAHNDKNYVEKKEYTEDYSDSKENLIKIWPEIIYKCILNSMHVTALGESLIFNSNLISDDVAELIVNLAKKIHVLLVNSLQEQTKPLKQMILKNINEGEESWERSMSFLLDLKPYDSEKGQILLYEDSIDFLTGSKLSHLNVLRVLLPKLELKTLPIKIDMFCQGVDLLTRVVLMKYIITNYFTADYNQLTDKKLILYSFDLILEIEAIQHSTKDCLLYNQDITKIPFQKVITVAEIANFFTTVLDHFPSELNMKHWDFIRIALSSWVLTISKNISSFRLPQISVFIVAVYKLHATMFKFINEQKFKSLTVMLTNMIDEWEKFFSLEISLVLFKTFFSILSSSDKLAMINVSALLDSVCPCMEYLDYSLIFNACKRGFQISLDECIRFLLAQLSNNGHTIRVTAAGIFRKLADFLVAIDIETLEKRIEIVERRNDDEWHLLCKLSPFALKYENQAKNYVKDFSYKLTEIAMLPLVKQEKMMAYLLLWDCIVLICSKAPAELRSFYARWITENQFQQTLLKFLIRTMPVEILKNYDSKVINNDMFRPLEWSQIKDKKLLIERYACHMYTQMLRYLPVVVRKWWNEANPRQKTFVDKLTTNYVSSLICHEELRAISNKKDKHENMQIIVHTSTREVIATYSIDDARMELVIALSSNHPLGSARIESEKQIGGRLQSRLVVRQLTIFLTHQNGSIFDVLSLWKKNLDKKFEGVEECYVCYSVIHQDTCQLPKLSCKTCRKKFHGPCLYKWFTTSSKSTCPICRNVF